MHQVRQKKQQPKMKKEFSRQISVTKTGYLTMGKYAGPVDVVKSATKIYTSFVEAGLLFARVHERRIQFMSM